MKRDRCPHKTMWMGLCATCGEPESGLPDEDYVQAPGFFTLDSGFQVKRARVLEMEQETLSVLREEKKGVLVFDLDHTIIHVTIAEIDHSEIPILALQECLETSRRVTEEAIYKFELDGSFFFLKLRPGVLNLLDWCKARFHLYVYTHGTVPYASVILQALDPSGDLFGQRVIARESIDRPAAAKRLSRIFPTEHKLCLVIDDRRDVWSGEAHENLIQVFPFLFFPDKERSAISLYGALRPSEELAGEDRQLLALREILDRLIALAFSDQGDPDIRPHLVALKSSVLADLGVITSGIIPVNEADPWSHPVSVALRELGAVEALTLAEVDVLIAASPHTEKARLVEAQGGKVVKPEYLLYALSSLKTPDVDKFLWKSGTFNFWEGGGVQGQTDRGDDGDNLLNDLIADLS